MAAAKRRRRRGGPSLRAAAAALGLGRAPAALAQLTVTSGPVTLIARLNDTGLSFVGETAVLAGPHYGDRYAGPLSLVELVPGRCEVASIGGTPLGDSLSRRSAWIAVLRAGVGASCADLAALARALQGLEAGPSAAVLLRPAVGAHLPLDAGAGFPEASVSAEDGGAAEVTMPSIWVSEAAFAAVADALSVAAAAGGLLGGVNGELAWGPAAAPPPPGGLRLELWMMGPAGLAPRLAAALRPLRSDVQLWARWPLQLRPLPAEGGVLASGALADHGAYLADHGTFCVPSAQLPGLGAATSLALCAPAPARTCAEGAPCGPESWVGLAAFYEVARQKCLRLAVSQEAQWEYLERLHAHCALADARDWEQCERCSARQMTDLGADAAEILRCGRERLGELLREEAQTPQPTGGGALRIAGWAYGGPLEVDLVVEAVCAALAPPDTPGPAACGGSWQWRKVRWFACPVLLWPHGVGALAASCALPLLLSSWVGILQRVPWPCSKRRPCAARRPRGRPVAKAPAVD